MPPAALPAIALAVTAAASVASAVETNQQIQHAKGAVEAQATEAKAALDTQKKADDANTLAKGESASATQQAALSALRAAMSGTGALGGTILTNPGSSGSLPTTTKTLLGQ